MVNDRILLVEDDADLRFVYELILKRAGYDLAVATNGKEALDMLESHDPRLILLDIFMPVMDGRQFLQSLDPSQRQGRTIVVCSNTSEDKTIEMVRRLGAVEVVLKARLDPPKLLELVGRYVTG